MLEKVQIEINATISKNYTAHGMSCVIAFASETQSMIDLVDGNQVVKSCLIDTDMISTHAKAWVETAMKDLGYA